MDKTRVFISHSHSDEGWVRQFASSLEQHGVDVWLDYHSLQWGESITEAVEKGLRESSVIVLLVTPDSIKSPNLFFEIGAAMGMRKPLIPVVSRELDPSMLPASLRERNYLVKGTPETTAQELVSQTVRLQ